MTLTLTAIAVGILVAVTTGSLAGAGVLLAWSKPSRLLPFVPTLTDKLDGRPDVVVEHQAAVHRLIMTLTEAWNMREGRRTTRGSLADLVDRDALVAAARDLDRSLDDLEGLLAPYREVANVVERGATPALSRAIAESTLFIIPFDRRRLLRYTRSSEHIELLEQHLRQLSALLDEQPLALSSPAGRMLILVDLEDTEQQWLNRLPGIGVPTTTGSARPRRVLSTWLTDDGLRAHLRRFERAATRIDEGWRGHLDAIRTHPAVDEFWVFEDVLPPRSFARLSWRTLRSQLSEVKLAYREILAHRQVFRALAKDLRAGVPARSERALMRQIIHAYALAFPDAPVPPRLPSAVSMRIPTALVVGVIVGGVLGGMALLVVASL